MSKNRSILDNVFTVWDKVSLAGLQGMPTPILLLDFKKAYDWGDWRFLEETMQRMGFQWDSNVLGFCEVSTLFISAHSPVLLAGSISERCAIARSTRQGCLLAPSLSLFFAKVMHYCLTAQETGLRGFRLPICEEDLLDAKFADDSAMYLAGRKNNLERF